jgi:hypothetical protein
MLTSETVTKYGEVKVVEFGKKNCSELKIERQNCGDSAKTHSLAE